MPTYWTNARENSAQTTWRFHRVLFVAVFITGFLVPVTFPQVPPKQKSYIAPEMQVGDPEIKAIVDSVDSFAQAGNYPECFATLQKALDLADKRKAVADRAILEDKLAVYYFLQGRLEDAKSSWTKSLSDGLASSNIVLQADVLVALSAIQQSSGNLDQSLKVIKQALELSKKSKSLYIQSRALGELSRLQLLAGKTADARASIEEAIAIDRANHYEWEAQHLLALAWVSVAESKPDKALELGASARDLAVKNENYLVFIQAATFVGQGYVQTGKSNDGIETMELARKGLSREGKPLFQSTENYTKAVSLPFLKVAFVEALAMAYEAAKRPDEALKSWQELYDIAHAGNFVLAEAEGARKVADLYSSKKEISKAIEYYGLAADASGRGGNQQKQIEALAAEASLLFQHGDKQRSLAVYEELLPFAKSSKNVRFQLIVDVAIAELLDGTDQLDRVESVLKDAESLTNSDGSAPNVEPRYLVEMHSRLSGVYEKRKDIRQELIELEKAVPAALAVGNTQNENKGDKPFGLIVQLLEAKIPAYHIREMADSAYSKGDFGDALVLFEIVQYFEEVDAAWEGKYDEYTKNLDKDKTITKLLQIPSKLLSISDGVNILTTNIETIGPAADRVRFTGLMALTNYYMVHQRPDMVVKTVTKALPYLKTGENDTPVGWDVAMSCELAYSLMLERDLDSAVARLAPCMASAKKLGDPGLLQQAHQTNVWVLEAAGKHDQAEDSIQYLLKQKTENAATYVQQAQFLAHKGDRTGAADAWRNAIRTYAGRSELSEAAAAHVGLANLLSSGSTADIEEGRTHLEAADAIYQKLGLRREQTRTETALGVCFKSLGNNSKARQYFGAALKMSHDAKNEDLEANVLDQLGQLYEADGDLSHAIEYYRKSSDLYQKLNDSGDAAFLLRKLAITLDSAHQPEQALDTILKAKVVSDASGAWGARYWVRRTLAGLYSDQGQYENSLGVLREAKQISDTASQPLPSAWARLSIAVALEVVGDWQEALEQINAAIPTLQRFNDVDDEFAAYTELSGIYGARESEIKDLQKSLEFSERASQLVSKSHPEKASLAGLDTVEVYWQMGRFKDAIAKAQETLAYYRTTKDELGQAGALISLAESQRSDGDLHGAEQSLSAAEPMVMRANNFYTVGRLYYGQAGLYRAEGRFSEAAQKYEQVINLLEKFKSTSNDENRRKVSENYDFIYDEIVDTYYTLSQKDTRLATSSAENAFEVAELNKARAFANSWGKAFITGLKRQVPLGLQDQEAKLAARRGILQSELKEALEKNDHNSAKKIGQELLKLDGTESELKGQLRQKSPAYAEILYPERIRVNQIPLRLGETQVQFKVLDQSTLIWVFKGTIEGGKLEKFYKVDRPRSWFSERVFRIRDAFNGGHPEQFDSKVTDDLLNALFPASVLQFLKTSKTVIFVPDDILFLLPFEMLSMGGQYPLLSTPTEYFPSSAAFRLSRTANRNNGQWQESFIGIADPVTSSDDPRYQAVNLISAPTKAEPEQLKSASVDRIVSRGFSLERLPETANEVESIAGLFTSTPNKTEVRIGMDATKQFLLRTDLGRYRFIHFATHGILPVESGIKEPALVLSYDGTGRDNMLLTLSDILDLSLHTDMVALSACNTGSGKVTKAEGVASLGNAFLATGASSVTVSLWQVADKSTAELMKGFYFNLLRGDSKAAALAQARAGLVAKGYDNPFFWAPFVLMGE